MLQVEGNGWRLSNEEKGEKKVTFWSFPMEQNLLPNRQDAKI